MTVTQDASALIALDWGTSSLRCLRFDPLGNVIERRAYPWGIMQLPATPGAADDPPLAFRAALQAACGDWLAAAPAAPLIAAGMVGSKQGWQEAAYLPIPVAPAMLAGQLLAIDTGLGRLLHIVPGLLQNSTLPNVMRGEETQIVGALRQWQDERLLIGLPGTHSKWVRIEQGRIVHFDTFMTGEVYGALTAHTILGRTMQPAAAPDDAAFLRGVAVAPSDAGQAGVLSTIFSCRTLGLTGALAPQAQADYLSGLLIGHELHALRQLQPETPQRIGLIGDAGLCRRYRLALELLGMGPVVQAETATELGLWQLAQQAGLLTRAIQRTTS